jgi:hypothetical protein
MIKLKSESPGPPRHRRAQWLLPLLLLVPVAALVEEHWRGHWELQSWKHEMVAKGEIFDPAELWPPLDPDSMEFSNLLGGVAYGLPGKLKFYGGNLSAIIVDDAGQMRRGSQESHPVLSNPSDTKDQSCSWQELDALLQQSQPGLKYLRDRMKDPPTGLSFDFKQRLENDSPPNFVANRVAAQALQASAMNNLHKGNLEGAKQDLEALLSFDRLGEDDPGLVPFMIRIAVIGMSVDVCWDALQAEGWTEPQLAELQSKCLDITNILSQMPRAMEAERIQRIYLLDWFRSHNYQEVIARYQNQLAGFGWKPVSEDIATPVQIWRQWVFHPLWSFVWAEQEELKYLQDVQPEVAALREANRRLSWMSLKEETSASHENYRPHVAAWRFYVRLPFVEGINSITGSKLQASAYPYADFSNAWFWTMRNLTLHEMVITAIATKRYELKHGKAPADLSALVPEFLPALPLDMIDGQPLRYQLVENGRFTLYSVGANGHDDGGAGAPGSVDNHVGYPQPWTGKDWVWPQTMKGINNSHVANATARKRGE